MSENETEDKSNSGKTTYVKTFRHGAIAANLFRRTAAGGFDYLDFALSRAWKAEGGQEGYSQNFFVQNRDAIKAVVDEACDYIEQNRTEHTGDPAA